MSRNCCRKTVVPSVLLEVFQVTFRLTFILEGVILTKRLSQSVGLFYHLTFLVGILVVTLMCRHLLVQVTCISNITLSLPSCETLIHSIMQIPHTDTVSKWCHPLSGIPSRSGECFRGIEGHGVPKGHGDVQRDFALHAGGASVVPYLTSPTHNLPSATWKSQLIRWITGYDFSDILVNLPTTTLEDDISVGHCWEFSGSVGHIGVHLTNPIHISDVTIHHVLSQLVSAVELQKAPRDMRLWGLLSDNQLENQLVSLPLQSPQLCSNSCFNSFPLISSSSDSRHGGNGTFLLLSEFTNTIPQRNVQMFPVLEGAYASSIAFEVVVLQILNNWGSNSTCVYHVGIHGAPLSDHVEVF
jgi:hypothetical protein